MIADRTDELQQHGFAYGELGLAITFTDGIHGEAAKRVRAKGWDQTRPLPNGPFGAALLTGRGVARNPAVVLRPSALIGGDVDGPEGVSLLRKIVPEGLPLTITVETGKESGYHFWFRPPPGRTQTAFFEFGPEGLKAKTNQYMVCPPAIHDSGRQYRFADGRSPWDLMPAVLPMSVIERLEKAARVHKQRSAVSGGPITAGGRHDHLMRLGCAMRRRGASLEAVEAALLAENEVCCTPPKPNETVRELARDLHARYQPDAA